MWNVSRVLLTTAQITTFLNVIHFGSIASFCVDVAEPDEPAINEAAFRRLLANQVGT
jgi:hypothetical protein